MTQESILNAVCKVFKVTPIVLSSHSKAEKVHDARALIVHLCKRYGLSVEKALELIGYNKPEYITAYKQQWGHCEERCLKERNEALNLLNKPPEAILKRTKVASTYHMVTYTNEEELRMESAIREAKEWGKAQAPTPTHTRIVTNISAYVQGLPHLKHL